jgi:glycosyltransferase involved in cell wall biosynthesis
MKLLVVIPTYDRANYLDKAIGAVVNARTCTRNCQVGLFLSDNCSRDHTPAVVQRWQEQAPWIRAHRWDVFEDRWSQVLKRAFLACGDDYDYLWLQGDDDWITDPLAYTKLAVAIKDEAAHPPAIVHCCQTKRAHAGDTRIVAGNTEEMCNAFGWHDMLGWISSLVISRKTIERTVGTPSFGPDYRNAAFSHSEGFLEAAYGRRMLVMGAGLIDTQDAEATPECIARWASGSVNERYWDIIPGLKEMVARGVITKPLSQGFFRYHTYTFWDRFAIEVMNSAALAATPEEVIERKLLMLGEIADLLGFSEDRKLYTNWLEGFRDDVRDVRRVVQMIGRRIQQSAKESFNVSVLPAPPSGNRRG